MTIKDIARRSGYAVGTVSRVLNGHPDVSERARAAILAVVEETGFRPNDNARHLKQRGSREVAVIVQGAGNLLFARILEAVQARIKALGGAAAVYYLDEDGDEVDQAIRVSRELKPQGILLLGGSEEALRTRFGQVKLPSVLVTARADSLGFSNLSSVSTDDVEGAAQAMGRLLDAGHRQIGIIGGTGTGVARLRLNGCRLACRRRGLTFDPALCSAPARFSLAGGWSAAQDLLARRPDLTAIFAMSDVMALGALRAICDKGLRVPQDISLMGYDGIDQAAYAVPRLATVRQDADRLACRGVDILLDQEGGPCHELVPFTLLSGESIGPPRA